MANLKKRFNTGPLDVLLSREDGKFYAHCLPFDLLGEGDNQAEAMKRLEEMIFEYIKFFIESNMEPFVFRPAPMKCWAILRMVKKSSHFLPTVPEGLLRTTSLNRIAPFLNTFDAPAYS